MKNNDEDPCIEGFHAVEWSRQVRREFGKKWSDENGNPDWEELKQILSEDREGDSSTSP